jgi:hypothetical protein
VLVWRHRGPRRRYSSPEPGPVAPLPRVGKRNLALNEVTLTRPVLPHGRSSIWPTPPDVRGTIRSRHSIRPRSRLGIAAEA